MSNPFMKKFNESESRGLNGLLLLGSFGVFSLFIGMITEERKKGNNRAVRDWSIAFGVSFALGILISLADFDILINKDNLVIDLITKGPFLLFSGAPYVLVSGLTSATNSIIGENGSKAFGLDDLNSKYGGRINQVVNLGKSDSSFILMNTFKYSNLPLYY